MTHIICVPVEAALNQSGRVEVVLRAVSDDGNVHHTVTYPWDFARNDAENIAALKGRVAAEMSAGVGVVYASDQIIVWGGVA